MDVTSDMTVLRFCMGGTESGGEVPEVVESTAVSNYWASCRTRVTLRLVSSPSALSSVTV